MRRGVIIAIVGGILAIVVLWYFLVFSPTSNELNDTRDEVATEKRRTLELEATVRRLQELADNAPQQEARLRALNAAIPATPDLADFILQANQIAATSGIDWLSISPTPPAAGSGSDPSTIALAIQIEGGFFQVLDYLNRFEDLERLVIIDAVDIQAANDEGTSGAAPPLSVSLTGRMFTRAAPVDATGDGSTGGSTTTPETSPATTPGATAGST